LLPTGTAEYERGLRRRTISRRILSPGSLQDDAHHGERFLTARLGDGLDGGGLANLHHRAHDETAGRARKH